MTVEFLLDYNRQYSWSQHGPFMFIGYKLFNGKVFTDASHFKMDDIYDDMQYGNGCFAAVLLNGYELTCWVDSAASFPLFYKVKDDHLIIADFEESLPHATGPFYEQAKDAMLHLYCTEGSDTLLEDWKTIPAGHYLTANLKEGVHEMDILPYYYHFSDEKYNYHSGFIGLAKGVFNKLANSIVAYCRNKTVLVPLSGGYDSRLILSMLVTGGHKDILCYTYGRSDSHEMMIAEKVANRLGVRHEKIIYNQEVFQAYFSDDWRAYENGNHHYISLPHEQEYFALNELKSRGLLPDTFVAIPGYCGDIAGGSYIREFQINPEKYVFEKTGYQPRHIIPCNPEDAWDVYQQWLCENRLSKFIVNGVRVFEHFGGKWMLPLWHFSFLNFFYSIPDEDRLGQKAYLEALFEIYFKPLGIDFRKPMGDTPSTTQSLKDIVKKNLPEPLLDTIRQYSAKRTIADPCNLHVLYEMIYSEMKESGHYKMPPKDYNINYLRAYKWMYAP